MQKPHDLHATYAVVTHDTNLVLELLDGCIAITTEQEFEDNIVWYCYVEYVRLRYLEYAELKTERILPDIILEELNYAYLANLIPVKDLRHAFDHLINQYRPTYTKILNDFESTGYRLNTTYGSWEHAPMVHAAMAFEGVHHQHFTNTSPVAAIREFLNPSHSAPLIKDLNAPEPTRPYTVDDCHRLL